MNDRRQFVQLCAGTAIASTLARGQAAVAAGTQRYDAARLVHVDGSPLKSADVPLDEAMVFAYPYRGVPCFLINLGDRRPRTERRSSPEDGDYMNPAGVGREGNLVAFVAICTHQSSYPRQPISVIRYETSGSALAGRPGQIVCCAHGSVFDPADGAQRVAGPAMYPLLPVELAWDPATDGLQAVGTVAETYLERFFKAFRPELIDGYGPGGYRQPVGEAVRAVRLSEYSAVVSTC